MHTDHAARHREGIDGGIVDDYQLDAAVLKLTVLHQLENQIFQIAVHEWIVEKRRLPTKAPEPHAT